MDRVGVVPRVVVAGEPVLHAKVGDPADFDRPDATVERLEQLLDVACRHFERLRQREARQWARAARAARRASGGAPPNRHLRTAPKDPFWTASGFARPYATLSGLGSVVALVLVSRVAALVALAPAVLVALLAPEIERGARWAAIAAAAVVGVLALANLVATAVAYPRFALIFAMLPTGISICTVWQLLRPVLLGSSGERRA